MKRMIQITEFLQKVFVVEAGTEDDALKIVDDVYRHKGDIVLDASDYAGNNVEDVTDDYDDELVACFPTIDEVVATSKRQSCEEWFE